MIVWLSSYPRSGNTLLRMLLKQVFGLNSYSKYNDLSDLGKDERIAEQVGHIPYTGSWEEHYEQARASADQVLVKTHEPPDDEQPAIYIVRDGRAVAVSYQHYHDNFGQRSRTLTEVLVGATAFRSWSDHLGDWDPLNRPHTLMLRYEDLLEHPETQIERLAEFLGAQPQQAFDNTFEALHEQLPTFFRAANNRNSAAEMSAEDQALFQLLHGRWQQTLEYPVIEPSAAATQAAQIKVAELAQSSTRARIELDQKLEQREATIRAKSSDISGLRLLSEERKKANDEHKKQLAALTAKSEALTAENKTQMQEISTLQQSVEQLREELTENNQALQALTQSLSSTTSQLRKKEAAFSHIEQVAEIRSGKIEDLEKALTGSPLAALKARRRIRKRQQQSTQVPETTPAKTPPDNNEAPANISPIDEVPAQKSLETTSTQHAAPAPPETSGSLGIPARFREIPTQTPQNWPALGIALFGFSRVDMMENSLTSLAQQGALGNVHVFLDGDQGNPDRRRKVDEVADVVSRFPIAKLHRRRGNLGFRKMMLQAMQYMSEHFEHIIFLEDDCFPTRHCVDTFATQLREIEKREDVFSVYGHPFLTPSETQTCTRFQGWGWATTSAKLKPVLAELYRCYLMPEDEFLTFTKEAMTDEVLARIDATPGRQPSTTLKVFFAWDETLTLLTALRGLTHQRSQQRVIYNCGADTESSHFTNIDYYRKPPFNMISIAEVWDHFDQDE